VAQVGNEQKADEVASTDCDVLLMYPASGWQIYRFAASKGQTITVITPNLRCSKWQGFRGRVLDLPSHPACRSQIDISFDGDFSQVAHRDAQGFHVQVCYDDYLREVGYALKTLGKVKWQNFSEGSLYSISKKL